MFSNGTEGDMFTGRWCVRCTAAVDGSLCDAAAPILWGDPPPPFLVHVPPSAADPTGVACTAFTPETRT